VSPDRDRSWVGAMAETYDRHLVPTVFHPFAVDLARRAWLEPDQLLATRSASELIELLS